MRRLPRKWRRLKSRLFSRPRRAPQFWCRISERFCISDEPARIGDVTYQSCGSDSGDAGQQAQVAPWFINEFSASGAHVGQQAQDHDSESSQHHTQEPDRNPVNPKHVTW